jgi:hypothetical protein
MDGRRDCNQTALVPFKLDVVADATVLTGGGGAPGPVNNLNSEIYYPPYLYATNGTPAFGR